MKRAHPTTATLARGKTRRGRDKVEAEIAAITRKPWVRRVVTWQLDGDALKDLRLTWSVDQGDRGRPRAHRMLTETTPVQDKLTSIFDLSR